MAHRQRLKKYGITQEQYEALVAGSGEVCQICGESNERTLHIDHCHGTQQIRGLLCNDCNNGLGRFHDDPVRLATAISYLGPAAVRQALEILNG